MKKVFLPLLFISALVFASCGSSSEHHDENYDQYHQEHDSDRKDMHASAMYICPCGGCPDVKEDQPGACPKCGMDLVKEKK